MKRKSACICLAVLILVTGAAVAPVKAGGPLYVTGPGADQPGRPYRWAMNPIPYQTDRGSLGNQANGAADALVAGSFAKWSNVSTADIGFVNTGQLSYDVTAGNVAAFINGIGDCSDTTQPVNAIVYDVDGSILKALGADNNSTLGFSGIVCTDDAAGTYTRGWVLMNGRFIDGQPSTPSHVTISLERFKMVFTHEFGHLAGLDHSQINLDCYMGGSCTEEDLAGLPLMFPVLLEGSTNTLKTDDVAALSAIYPAAGFGSTTGRIQGRVLFSDGLTPAQGYNVIARRVGDPGSTAVSCVSGYLFAAAATNPFAPAELDEELFFGSQDPSLIGFYDLPGLPPGEYTVEVEAIYNSGDIPFIDASGVGPIGNYLLFQYKLPGRCAPQYLNFPSSPGDGCTAKTTVSAIAGTVTNENTDIIFLGTPPRYDAWEDGP